MNNIRETVMSQSLQWKWVWISFCFYVSFHLLPSYVTGGFFAISYGNPWNNIVMLAWIFLGVGIVGAFIGYRSRGITVLEPAIASLLYIIVLSFSIPRLWPFQMGAGHIPNLLLAMISAFVVAAAGGAFGEVLQERKRKKTPDRVNP